MRFLVIAFAVLTFANTVAAQEAAPIDDSKKLFLDADVGIQSELGFMPPASDFGLSTEIPLRAAALRRIELQAGGYYSPDRTVSTRDGHVWGSTAGGVLWISWRIGAYGFVNLYKRYTSQFDGSGAAPYLGAVIRTGYWHPGRLYAYYKPAEGCALSSTGQPCPDGQSYNLLGLTARQEFLLAKGVRLSFADGAWHYCQTPNVVTGAHGKCHWAGTEMVQVRIQLWHPSSDRY